MALVFGMAACSNTSDSAVTIRLPTTTTTPTTSDPTTTTTTPTTTTPTETAPAPAATYTITFNANDGSETPATAAQTFTAEIPQALKTIAELGFSKTGFYFAGWGEAANAEQAKYSDGTQYVAEQDATLYALWSAMPVYSVKVLDNQSGTVVAEPAAGIAGTEIALTAQPKNGYQFVSYAVVDAASNPISVADGKFTMPQSEVFVAGAFVAINYNIVVGTAANGSVTASAQTATVGTEVTLTAIPDNGYKLAGLVVKDSNGASVATSEAEGSVKFTMPAQNVTVTATFSVNGHTVTFNANDGSQSPATATQDFAHGVAAALKSVEELGFAKPGSYFAGWGLKADARSASYADGAGYICVEDKTLYALWTALPVYKVNTPVSSFGIVTATPATGYPGAEITLKVEPNAGYLFDSWAVADAAGNPIPLIDGKFTMPEGEVTVTATFTAINYKVNVGAPENGTVTANAATATVGTEVALDIAPNPGYFLESLAVMTDSGSPVNFSVAGNARTFRMPAQNVTVTATFSRITYRIDVGAAENGSVVASTAAAAEGADVTLDIAPASGYALEALTVTAADGSLVSVSGTDNAKSFKMPAQNVAVSASFVLIDALMRSIPLTLEAVEAGTKVTFDSRASGSVTYRINGGDVQTNNSYVPITLKNAGDKVAFYGDNSTYSRWNNNTVRNSNIECDKDCYVYGNIMSLVSSDAFASADTLSEAKTFYRLFYCNAHIKNKDGTELVLPATKLTESCYAEMFNDCYGLTSAPKIFATTLAERSCEKMFRYCTSLISASELPAAKLASHCYDGMFQGCTSLVNAPELSATTLASYCYSSMFQGCTSLTSSPVLRAEILAEHCCNSMFQGCTSLTSAPALLATTLARNCYSGMFSGCTSLVSAPALPATTLVYSCYSYMFSGCTSLERAPELPATKLYDSCCECMFKGCTKLTIVPELSATTLAESCYERMFFGCTSLVSAPAILATSFLSNSCKEMFSGCTSLTRVPDFIATMVGTESCIRMFEGCTSLTSAPALPATTLSIACYDSMFSGCTSLIRASELPATTLAKSCYYKMFSGCTSLTNVPALPATTLADYCYSGMFSGCTSLTNAPDLPATTLASYCYISMFQGCTSLTSSPALPATTLAKDCYSGMFSGCTSLTSAPALLATTLADYCYSGMFSGCTSLVSAPALPATTLVYSCYSYMFSGCTSLERAPELPATKLYDSCYSGMFSGCTSLTSAPALPATTLADYCYSGMFKNCEKLDSVACLATNISANGCTSGWLVGVADNGTFIKKPSMTAWTEGNSGIPSGWTVKDNGGSVKILDNIKNGTVKSNWTICSVGQTVTLTITPESGYKLSSLVVKAVDGEIIETSGTSSKKTFTMPAKNVTVSAEFVAINYKVTCGTFEHGSVVASASTAIKGQTVTLTINPDSGYLWDYLKVSANGSLIQTSGTGNTRTFTMPVSAVTVSIRFMKKAEKPLIVEAIEDSAVVTFVNKAAGSVTYKINDGTGKTIASGSTCKITLSKAGDKVAFYGDNATYAANTDDFSNIGCDKYCYVYGNIMSLIKSDGFESLNDLSGSYAFYQLFYNNTHIKNKGSEELLLPATTLTEACYSCMFKGCESLSEAPALPATTLTDNCYGGMFNSCKGLTKAPELPATKLAKNCYQGMLCFCASLTKAPALPATTLAERCYQGMFKGCTKLTKAPALPATTLAGACYSRMFSGCSKLTSAPELSATALAGYCYAEMFSSCTSLTSAPALPATTLTDHCYDSMFSGCTSLAIAPSLPAMTLAGSCYYSMFSGCTSLTSAPALLATTLAGSCCESMFSGCTSLTSAPALSATTLARSCYKSMFSGCTGLVSAPDLPATTLDSYCYYSMFSGCTSLTSAPTLPAMTLGYHCYESMFSGCTSLTKAPELPATSLMNSCYKEMFKGCSRLTSAPELPAMSLDYTCYKGMFADCTSLANAPSELPAWSLPGCTKDGGCYESMFAGCTSLVQAPALRAKALETGCYKAMFKGCVKLKNAPDLRVKVLSDFCYEEMFYGCKNLERITCLAEREIVEAVDCTKNWLYGVAYNGVFTRSNKGDAYSYWKSKKGSSDGIPGIWKVEIYKD